LDKDWENNQEDVKSYVDSLSEEDYKIWRGLKDEGYSLSARKALFDNREDLWDITNP
jgi:hypothetical protein